MQPTQKMDSTCGEMILAVALELSAKSWKVCLQGGGRARPAIHTVSQEVAGDRLRAVVDLIEHSKLKWGLGDGGRVEVIYEAGQDGFWISRALSARGYAVRVVDPASIPVERHARRAKTDRLDVLRLLSSLLGWLGGEHDRMHVVREPSECSEGQRHLVRERGLLQKEIGQHRDRMRKLLRTVGCWTQMKGDFAARVHSAALSCHDGRPLPDELRARLLRECERLALAETQLKRVESSLAEHLAPEAQQRVVQLSQLRAIGPVGAQRLVLELLWRNFNNRREVGACVGLVPQPYDSGQSRVDQGISKQGNRRVRALLIEMAWMWLRYQPDSAISRWFARRCAHDGPNKRARRIAIVAVARRLVIALWRYVKEGVIPEGAVLKRA